MGDSTENFDCKTEDGFVLTPQETPKARVIVQEHDYAIRIKLAPTFAEPLLSVPEARELARRLYVLAKRLERKIG